MLGAAIALPAIVAPQGWNFSDAGAVVPQVTPMGFETPGESFPGSAFYYLDDLPYLPQGDSVIADRDTAGGDANPADAPARPMLADGTPLDRVRAQKCLTMAIYYEAALEPDAGQQAVAQVVLNRVANGNYPDNICGVVFQGSDRSTGCQFTFTCDGSLARQPEKRWWDRAAKVARAALSGAVYKPVGLATHYHTLAVNPHWAGSLQPVGTIGAHRFYRWRGMAGTSSAFTRAYAGGEPLPAPYLPAPPAAKAGVAAPSASVQAAAVLTGYEPVSIPEPFPGTKPAIAQPPGANPLDRSGTVKPQYARSGQWLDKP